MCYLQRNFKRALSYPFFFLHPRYLRALAAFYVRLTFEPADVYKTLEPLLADYRKLRRRVRTGGYTLTHMDEFVDELLTRERVCATSLWKLPARQLLEDLQLLDEYESPLRAELEAEEEEEEAAERETEEQEGAERGEEDERQDAERRDRNGEAHGRQHRHHDDDDNDSDRN